MEQKHEMPGVPDYTRLFFPKHGEMQAFGDSIGMVKQSIWAKFKAQKIDKDFLRKYARWRGISEEKVAQMVRDLRDVQKVNDIDGVNEPPGQYEKKNQKNEKNTGDFIDLSGTKIDISVVNNILYLLRQKEDNMTELIQIMKAKEEDNTRLYSRLLVLTEKINPEGAE